MSSPPAIELDGLRLRALRPDDAEALHAYLRDPAVTELISHPAVTPALAEATIERARNRWAAGEPSKWGMALAHDDRLIGSPAHRWTELACDLAQDHWGKG